LQTKTITLLNPATWDDKNDSYYMSEYKRRKHLTTVLALCFARCNETYHHWRVFSHGFDGVRIEFDKNALLSYLDRSNLICKAVEYPTIDQMDATKTLAVDDLPFIKRYPYQDEREFRIVYWSKQLAVQSKGYPIGLETIKRITLSPWMNKKLSDTVVKTLRSIPGCKRIEISRSTLVENERWKAFTEKCR
jgi:hypothetical protein